MMNTVALYAEHAQTCEEATGYTMEYETIYCRVDGKTGECVKHDLGDAETTEIYCEGCGLVLWSA